MFPVWLKLIYLNYIDTKIELFNGSGVSNNARN